MLARFNDSRLRLGWYILATLLAVFTYFYGLDSQQIPKNSDEYLYVHIARLTADSGHMLPLQSEFSTMRNVKPPLMFWHAIAATEWGEKWDLWHLRYPSVIYTLLTALMVFLLARRLTGSLETGFIALLSYLAFYSTYRFGRPYLTDPGTVFWLFTPFFTLLYWRPLSFESRFWFPLLLGLETGLGLLYKSFFFVLPVGLGLMWWYLHHRHYRWREFLLRDSWKPVLVGVLALALFFGLWLGLDPDPATLWREFFWVENMGKVTQTNYLGKMFWGASSIWSLALGYPQNAALTLLLVFGLFWVAFRQRKQATDHEKMLWILMAALFFMFSLASQRSARYLLEAMPALAILLALYWQRLPRWLFMGTLVLCGVVLGVLAYIALRLEREMGMSLYDWSYWAMLAITVVLLLAALVFSRLTRMLSNGVVILTYLFLALSITPFDGAPGNYSAEALQYAKGKDVWVPCNKFIGKDEGHRFLLPGANVLGYYEHLPGVDGASLSHRFRVFALRLPMQEKVPCTDCRVIGQRLEISGRQYDNDFRKMLDEGEVFNFMFVREWLVESTIPALAPAPEKPVSECR